MPSLSEDSFFVVAQFLTWKELAHFSEINKQLANNLVLENNLWQAHFKRFFSTKTPVWINNEINYKASFKHYYPQALQTYPKGVSKTLKNDKMFVFDLLKQSIWNYLHLESRFKNDKEVFHYSLKQSGLATLQFSKALQDNKAAVFTSVLKDPWTFEFASPRLKKDKDIIFAYHHQKMALLSRHKILSGIALMVFVAFVSPMVTTESHVNTLDLAAIGGFSAWFLRYMLFDYLRMCEFFPQYERLNTMKLAYTVGAGILFAAGVSGLPTSLNGAVIASGASVVATVLLRHSNFFKSQRPLKEILAAKIAEREAEWVETTMEAPGA